MTIKDEPNHQNTERAAAAQAMQRNPDNSPVFAAVAQVAASRLSAVMDPRPWRSEAIDLLSSAMAQAQAELPNVGEDSKNDYFGHRYASLGAIVKAVKPVLGTHGLWVWQDPYLDGHRWCVRTYLMHASGQFISNLVQAVPTVNSRRGPDGESGEPKEEANVLRLNPQRVASANTYLRRLGLSAILGIATEEDDDAEACQDRAADDDELKHARLRQEVRRIANARMGKEEADRWICGQVGDVKPEDVSTAKLNEMYNALRSLKPKPQEKGK